jgi:hypothetical protein
MHPKRTILQTQVVQPPVIKKPIVALEPEVINAIAGAVAGGLTATFVCPLDVLKTRLQVLKISERQGGIAGMVWKGGKESVP